MTKVCVTALIGNTYHARVHMSTSGKDASSSEVDIDARPSDAINLAVRFNAPVYVNKQVLISLEQLSIGVLVQIIRQRTFAAESSLSTHEREAPRDALFVWFTSRLWDRACISGVAAVARKPLVSVQMLISADKLFSGIALSLSV